MSDVELPFSNAVSPEVREFLVAAHDFCGVANPKLTVASLSSLLFGSGRQIARLVEGNDITTGRLRAAWERLRELQAGGPRTRKPRNSKGASNGSEDQCAAQSGEEAEHANQRTRRSARA